MTTKWPRLAAIVIAAPVFVAIAADIFNSPAYANKVGLRYFVSIVGATFSLLCLGGMVFALSAIYWFLRMVNSPREGLSILDAGMFKGRAVFSRAYLSSFGLEARGRFFAATGRFAECWLGAVLLAAIMYFVVKRST